MSDDAKNKLAGSTEQDAAAPDAPAAEPAQQDGTDPVSEAGRSTAAAVDVHAYIGRQLRAVYDDVAKQPVPERFLALMKQLEQQTEK
jgi:hypothetical protein